MELPAGGWAVVAGMQINSRKQAREMETNSGKQTMMEQNNNNSNSPAHMNGRRSNHRSGNGTIKRSSASSTSSSSSCAQMFDLELGNKCGKCQNHELEVSKKGHARDCPFKRCECLKCRLLDARSDILQVISGKETKLKGTKKDPNCGFCQNHGVKILRKGHVRSCGFGQERHFKLENCFDCEVHYIRNEVNRLQIKMRRAMKEDRTLSEEQRKTAREAITREEVEKVCDMARLARKKRETILSAQQVGESSALQSNHQAQLPPPPVRHSSGGSGSGGSGQQQHGRRNNSQLKASNGSQAEMAAVARAMVHHNHQSAANASSQASVWRPWSQQQVVAAAFAAQQQQQQQQLYLSPLPPPPPPPQQPQQLQPPQPSSFGQHHVDLQQVIAANQVTRVCSPAMQQQPQQQQQTAMVNCNNNQALDLGEQANEFQAQQRQQLFNTIFRLFFAQIAQQSAPAANSEH